MVSCVCFIWCVSALSINRGTSSNVVRWKLVMEVWVCILRGELEKGLCGFERRGYADLGTDRLQSDELMMILGRKMVAVCTLLLRNADARGGQQGKLPQLLKEMAYKQSWIATRSIYNTVNHGPVQVAYPLISLFLSSMFSLSPDYLASLIHGGGYCVTSGCEFCCFYYAGLMMVIVH